MAAMAWLGGGILLGWLLGGWRRRARADEQSSELALWASGEELWDVDALNGRLRRRGRLPDADRLDGGGEASLEAFFATVHPDDRGEAMQAMQRVLAGEDERADVAFRAGLKSGGWVWLHACGRVAARTPDGRVARIVGTTRSISALKENEQRLRLALHGAAEELWELDLRQGRVRRENQRPELPFEAADLEGVREALRRLVPPEDAAELGRQLELAASGALAELRVTYRVRRPDGGLWWMSSQGQALDPDADGRPRRLIGTTRNVSEIKEGEVRLRLALWGSGAELWDIDMSSGEIRREGELTLLPERDPQAPLHFRDVLAATHPDDVEGLKRAMVAHAKGQADAFQASFRTRLADGWRWRLARGRVTARDRDGWATRMLGTVHDINALKAAETQLRRLNEELEARVAERTAALSRSNAELRESMEHLRDAQRQLVEAEKMAALGSLVAGVAHEINTPLGIGVTAASQLQRSFDRLEAPADAAERDAALAQARRCVELVLRNLERADQLVKSFKQIAVDQSDERPRRLRLRAYLEEVLTSLQPVLKRRPLRLAVDCDPALEATLHAGALYQLLMNLVVNSATHGYGPDDAGTLQVALARHGEDLVLDYRDDGRGMTEEVRQRVFEPFFTTRRGSGGTGLGMHLCYNLVTQRLRGSIRCDSAPGAGVHFQIRFPAG